MARGLRAELAALLSVDQYTLEDIAEEPSPPQEATSARLSHLIMHAVHYPIEARAVYSFLPALMLRIFGYTSGQGWMETISQHPSRDRESLLSIVAPEGPLHSFCKQASSPKSNHTSAHAIRDMRFEFSLHNLPSNTREAITTLQANPSRTVYSYLARILLPHLKSRHAETVMLDPLTYFTICMVASPAHKFSQDGLPEGHSPVTMKRIKRSVSLPSTRALYNQLIASYASALSPMSRVSEDNVFIPAVLDFLFLPWALATPDCTPNLSASMADAATSLLISLAPSAPEALELEEGPIIDTIPPMAELDTLTNTSCLYRLVPYMLSSFIAHLSPNDSAAPAFLAYTRMLALHVSPWRGPVRSSIRSMLFPKPRSSSPATLVLDTRNNSMQSTLSNTFSTINAHLPSPQRSPNNASAVKESRWRAAFANRLRSVDVHLVCSTVVRAASLRVAMLAEGNRVLSVLTDAGQSARLAAALPGASAARDDGALARGEEFGLCIEALRTQQAASDTKGLSRSERAYLTGLAGVIGVQLQSSSVLHNISEMVHGGAHSVKDVVDCVAGTASASGTPSSSAKKRRVLDRRMSLLRGADSEHDKGNVPFFGSVWDRPIEQGEFEPFVMAAYWVALRAEPYLGYIPNTRILGRVWVWVFCTLVSVVLTWGRGLLWSATAS